jgi:hypothetical protein
LVQKLIGASSRDQKLWWHTHLRNCGQRIADLRKPPDSKGSLANQVFDVTIEFFVDFSNFEEWSLLF